LDAARNAAAGISDPRMAQEASKVIDDWPLFTRNSQIVR